MPNNPTLIPDVMGVNAEKNSIPTTDNGTTGKASIKELWQSINSLPLSAGGKAVDRLDFNGLFSLLGGIDYMTQRGYTFEWDSNLPYVVGCIVIDTNDGKTYRCVNDVPAGGSAPSLDTTNWIPYDIADYVGGALRVIPYSVGDTSTLANIPAGYFLECTTAGITGTTAPVVTTPVSAGQTISDGTVVWTVRKTLSATATDLGYVKQMFASSGSFTPTITGLYRITLKGGSGGGGGAWTYGTGHGAGGGGGEGGIITFCETLIAGTAYPFIIGAGGSGGSAGNASSTSGSDGTSGGESSISINSNTYTATGGGKGYGYSSYGMGGIGGCGKKNGIIEFYSATGENGNTGSSFVRGGAGGKGANASVSNAPSIGGAGAGGGISDIGVYGAGGAGGDGYIILECLDILGEE